MMPARRVDFAARGKDSPPVLSSAAPGGSQLAQLIARRLQESGAELSASFRRRGGVRSFVVDGLLPENIALAVYRSFPETGTMLKRHSLRESKYFAAQLDRHDPLIESVVFAFQDPRVVALLGEICGMSNLLPDPRLYAGGVSAMVKGSFLNPHLDNSHDASQKHYRLLNSLYYVTPDWREEYGGNLELWDQGPKGTPRTIHSRFNRLVVMETNRQSWHSVSRVRAEVRRTCVSNYFFREQSLEGDEYFHATSFRGRPEQPGRDLLLRADTAVRTAILSLVNVPTKHIYRR
jgi:Rps23 Pro-64 3,4-dihydroxylase Tpa1-like proline 4-hydroxylase